MTTAPRFLARHPSEEHPYLAAVHAAWISDSCVLEPPTTPVSCNSLLTIYHHRAVHLTRFKARHAQDLRDDVLRFCERLAASPGASAQWWTFRLPDAVLYNFIEHSDTHRLLGALRTVSKLDVPAEEWDRLWNA